MGKLQQFGRKSAQREENVAGLVPPMRFWQAGDLRLEGAQIAQPRYAVRAPLAFTREVSSVIEFRHEVDFGATVPAPVPSHLLNREAEALFRVQLKPLAADFFKHGPTYVIGQARRDMGSVLIVAKVLALYK